MRLLYCRILDKKNCVFFIIGNITIKQSKCKFLIMSSFTFMKPKYLKVYLANKLIRQAFLTWEGPKNEQRPIFFFAF